MKTTNRIITVLLCDDNSIITNTLLKTIPWKDLGCQVIGVAKNGKDALDIAKSINIDLVITDICMPEISGLDLIENLKQVNKHFYSIIISGFDDFKYARKAIQLGTINYILKPINDVELIDAITLAQEKITQDDKNEATFVTSQDISNQLKKNLILNIINDNYNSSQIIEKQLEYGFSIQNFAFLFIGSNSNDVINNNIAIIQDIVQSECGPTFEVLCMSEKDIIKYFFHYSNQYDVNHSNSILHTICFNIKQQCEQKFNSQIFISCSTVHENILEVKLAFYQASYMYNNVKYHLQNNSFVFAEKEHFEDNINHTIALISTTINEIKIYKNCEFKSLDELIYNLSQINDSNEFKAILYYISMQIASNFSKFSSQSSHDFLESNNQSDALNSLKSFLLFINQNSHSSKYAKVIKQLNSLLLERYAEKLTITEVSELLDISSSHLNRIIKKEKNTTFVDILNSIRIEKATELLSTGNYKVYEVASMVGIENYAYFHMIYKKYTGQKPSDVSN